MKASFLLNIKHLVQLKEQISLAKGIGCQYLVLFISNGGHTWQYIKDDKELKKIFNKANVEDKKEDNHFSKQRLVALFNTKEEIPTY